MPPLTVYWDGSQYWLADGFHRYHAALEAGLSALMCEVIKGTREAAQWHAIGANKAHGLRRTNADKRRSVDSALSHPNAATMTDVEIAEHCGVSREYVNRNKRGQKCDPITPGTNGKYAEPAKTKAVSRSEVKPASEPEAEPTPWPGDDSEPDAHDDPEFEAVDSPDDLVRDYDTPVKSFVRKLGLLETEFAVMRAGNKYTQAFFDPLVEEEFRRRLKNVKHVITSARPHAVCGWCNGEGCPECEQTGALPRGKAEMVL